jgi:DeoR/GlpR family transcriptional regulator of sugar metabolism
MKTTNRRKEILNLVDVSGKVSVEQLVNEYNVSLETIRRDLRILDQRGFVKRVYGGAVKLEKAIRDIPYVDRISYNQEQKQAIAVEAAKLLEDGDCVFIDGKTTCLTLTEHIPVDLELTIVTNSVFVALNLSKRKTASSVFLVGGELDDNGMTTGPKLNQELKGYRFDKAFFSCIAIDTKGCYYAKAEPQQLAQTLADISAEVIILADSAKVNRSAFLLGLKMFRIQKLVTDEGAPPVFINTIKSSSCEAIVAKLEDKEE